MTKRYSFSVPDNPSCGDISKGVIRMLEKNFDEGTLSNITYFIEEWIKSQHIEEDENKYD
jgi:hypothetical protein